MDVEEGKVNLVSEKRANERRNEQFDFPVNATWHCTCLTLLHSYPTGEQGGRLLFRSSGGCQHVGASQVHDGRYVGGKRCTSLSWYLEYSRSLTPRITLLEDNEEDLTEIPLPNVKSTVLQKVIEFCEHHKEEPMTEIEKPLKSQNMNEVVQKWYADFVNVEQVLLFELILAANYMDIKPLLDLTCATVASMIKGKTPEEIRTTFNISNDFSPEEEAQVREENKWCEEA